MGANQEAEKIEVSCGGYARNLFHAHIRADSRHSRHSREKDVRNLNAYLRALSSNQA
jgi:hypothetical protein